MSRREGEDLRGEGETTVHIDPIERYFTIFFSGSFSFLPYSYKKGCFKPRLALTEYSMHMLCFFDRWTKDDINLFMTLINKFLLLEGP
jgi:hypothetical protein